MNASEFNFREDRFKSNVVAVYSLELKVIY